jgi:hypothetical protein
MLTLTDIAQRADIEVQAVVKLAIKYDLPNQPHENIPSARRGRLEQLIRDAEFQRLLTAASAVRWQSAHDYYRNLGFGRQEPIGLVDVGWNGRMQASMRRILEKGDRGEGGPVQGFYFCLTRKVRVSAQDGLEGFAFDPDRDRGANELDGYRAMVEAMLEADHGTTLGFATYAGTIAPVLGHPPTGDELRYIRWQQDAVLAFVRAMGHAEAAIGRPITIDRDRALRVMLAFLRRPLREEAAAFAMRERAEGQVESRTEALVSMVPFGRHLISRKRLGFWPEGTLSYSGHRWLLPILALLRAARKHEK